MLIWGHPQRGRWIIFVRKTTICSPPSQKEQQLELVLLMMFFLCSGLVSGGFQTLKLPEKLQLESSALFCCFGQEPERPIIVIVLNQTVIIPCNTHISQCTTSKHVGDQTSPYDQDFQSRLRMMFN